MSLKELKKKRWFRIMSNKYLVIIIGFGIWMLFFDSNSWLVQHKLNQKIDKLSEDKVYYKDEINSDRAIINQLKDSEGLERYAREKYFMKRKDEDIYIIQYQDSLKDK